MTGRKPSPGAVAIGSMKDFQIPVMREIVIEHEDGTTEVAHAYGLKLTDETVTELKGGEDIAIGPGGPSGAGKKSLALNIDQKSFGINVIHNEDPSNEWIWSHRNGENPRSVAQVVGTFDIERPLSKETSALSKRRTLASEQQKKNSSTLMMLAHEEPKPKRTRTSTGSTVTRKAPAVKRPRSSLGASGTPLNGLSAGATGINGSARRSALPVQSPSPHVSPPGLPNGNANGRSSMHARASAALGNGKPPRSSAHNGFSSNRSSAGPSPASRGTSPARMSSAPCSPRVAPRSAPLATDSMSPAEMQKYVMHILALGAAKVSEIAQRLNGSANGFEEVRKAAKTVGVFNSHSGGMTYALKPDCWSKVTADYNKYSSEERAKVAKILMAKNASGAADSPKGSAVSPSTGGSGSSSGLGGKRRASGAAGSRSAKVTRTGPKTPFTARVPTFSSELEKHVTKTWSAKGKKVRSIASIKNMSEFERYKQHYESQYHVYSDLHKAIESMKEQIGIARHERRAASPSDLPYLKKDADAFLDSIKATWEKYEFALTRSHDELKSYRSKIESWGKSL